jgi:cell division transport system permease protein
MPNTWTHVRRSPYQALAAILTMFLTFLLGGVFFLATITSVLVLQFFESKPQITVFFTDKATADDAKTLEHTLDSTGKVASMNYVSKDDALKIYQQQNKSDPLLLEMVTADILPASLEVSAKDPTYLSELDPLIQKAQGVEEVVFQKDVVDTLLSWTNAIRLVGGSLAILLAIDSLLIIMTVISMKIALKREEIEILKLVGASPWYIRMPFIMEGGLYGASGAFMAWAIVTGMVIWLRPMAVSFLGMIPAIQVVLGSLTAAPFLLTSAGFMGAMLLVGFFLGSVGSLVALGRYLKI